MTARGFYGRFLQGILVPDAIPAVGEETREEFVSSNEAVEG